MTIKNTQKSGFTLVEIMIVVAIIGLLAAIAIPNFVRARAKAQATACIANMKQLDGAVEVWATENKKKTTDAVVMAELVPNYIKVLPTCPATGAYVVGAVGASPSVSCPNVATLTDHLLPGTAAPAAAAP